MVDQELTRYLENDNNGDPNRYETKLRELVIEAATNRDIMLDGVYTLVRRDPLAIVPKSYKINSTATVEKHGCGGNILRFLRTIAQN